MNENNLSPMVWAVIIVVALAAIGSLTGSHSGGSSSPTPSSSSAEQRYVEQRFRQEGYSAQDSATAAEAVLKFQRAQGARRN